MFFKFITVFLFSMAFACSASDEKSSDEKYQRILRNYFDIYIGHFQAKPKEEKIFNDPSFPGGGFVVRKFKIEKVIVKSYPEKPEILDVRVPLDLLNKDKFTYRGKIVESNSVERKIREINRSETLSEAQWAEMKELKKQLKLEEYLVNVLALEQKLNYDFSLGPDIKYFSAVHKGRDGHFSLSKNLDKLVPFGRDHFIEDIDFKKHAKISQ